MLLAVDPSPPSVLCNRAGASLKPERETAINSKTGVTVFRNLVTEPPQHCWVLLVAAVIQGRGPHKAVNTRGASWAVLALPATLAFLLQLGDRATGWINLGKLYPS